MAWRGVEGKRKLGREGAEGERARLGGPGVRRGERRGIR
jgi:hypothetical protein